MCVSLCAVAIVLTVTNVSKARKASLQDGAEITSTEAGFHADTYGPPVSSSSELPPKAWSFGQPLPKGIQGLGCDEYERATFFFGGSGAIKSDFDDYFGENGKIGRAHV